MTERTQGIRQVNQKIADQNSVSTYHPNRWPLILIVCGVIIFFLGKGLFKTYQQGIQYQEDYLQAQTNNQQAVEQNRIIQEEYQRVNDPNYLAEIARRDYYYSKEGEIIFILPEDTKD